MKTDKYEKWMERYGEEYLRRLAQDGLEDREIAQRSGISEKTFERWKRTHKEFASALRLGRRGSDYNVIEALYKKAIGYTVSVNKTYKLKRTEYDPDTGKKLREYEELATGADESHIPADVRAGSFWLKNRQPEMWSDKTGMPERESATGEIEIPDADLIGSDDEGEE